MTNYTINILGRISETEEFDVAKCWVKQRFPNAVFGEWESIKGDDAFLSRKRLLVWKNQEEALNDDGSNAVAEICETVC